MNSTNTESSDFYLNLEHFTLLDPSSPRAIPELEGVYVWALKPECTLPKNRIVKAKPTYKEVVYRSKNYRPIYVGATTKLKDEILEQNLYDVTNQSQLRRSVGALLGYAPQRDVIIEDKVFSTFSMEDTDFLTLWLRRNTCIFYCVANHADAYTTELIQALKPALQSEQWVTGNENRFYAELKVAKRRMYGGKTLKSDWISAGQKRYHGYKRHYISDFIWDHETLMYVLVSVLLLIFIILLIILA